MNKNAWWGLFKSYKNEERLDQLVAGRIYCNTPEYYRQNDEAGVGDPNESVSLALRGGRGIEDFELRINDRPISGLTRVVLRGTGMKDRWLHCWTLLRHPADDAAFKRLIANLQRIRTEFGGHYAYIIPENIERFFGRLRELSGGTLDAVEVSYSDDMLKRSPICKGAEYAYQREVRFLFDECPEKSVEPRIFDAKGGFGDLILKSPELRMVDQKQGKTWLAMKGNETFAVTEPDDE